ncbi:MAG: ribulose-phosphate 3-epimerase [Alphaproteobacteria bacterium]|nr:ribulose-phosphate 3-epimerase [Alphaproteobacteria bacterium]
MVKVAPSILSADFSRLGQEVSDICKDGADFIHVDIMDGHFVPNLTFGAMVLKSIKPYSTVPIDVHLMISNPKDYLKTFVLAGANRLTIHQEINGNIGKMLSEIRSLGVKAGLCLKPQTPVEVIEPYLDLLDLVLVMTVEPGFGGQSFMEDKLPKITALRKMIGDRPIDIEVDGGINDKTGQAAVLAGADVLIAGNYIFKAENRKKAIRKLKGKKE